MPVLLILYFKSDHFLLNFGDNFHEGSRLTSELKILTNLLFSAAFVAEPAEARSLLNLKNLELDLSKLNVLKNENVVQISSPPPPSPPPPSNGEFKQTSKFLCSDRQVPVVRKFPAMRSLVGGGGGKTSPISYQCLCIKTRRLFS